jgi:hypothetical protein
MPTPATLAGTAKPICQAGYRSRSKQKSMASAITMVHLTYPEVFATGKRQVPTYALCLLPEADVPVAAGIVQRGKIGPHVRPAALLTLQRRVDHQPGDA